MTTNDPSQSEDINGGPRVVSSLLDNFKQKEDMISLHEKNTFAPNRVISVLYITVIGYVRRLTTLSMLLRVRGSLRKIMVAS